MDQAAIDERFEKIERTQVEHSHQIADTRQRLLDAFPAGDTEGHRRYHEAQIERLHELRRLRVAVQEKTIAGLVWAAMLGIGIACWQYFKAQILKLP